MRAYPDRLAAELRALEAAVSDYRGNLARACELLDAAGVTPVLIKALPDDDFTYSNFDLVVGDDGWDRALEALSDWTTRRSVYPLERRTKMLLYPPSGPAVHLHRSVAWFDIPVVSTAGLRAGAIPAVGVRCLLPAPSDRLRILLAHAAFQNHALSLAELREVRALAPAGSPGEIVRRAGDEGWGRGFRTAWSAARLATVRLDAGDPPALPVPMPLGATAATAFEHAAHLARSGAPLLAARELVLLGPLLVAKRRAAARAAS